MLKLNSGAHLNIHEDTDSFFTLRILKRGYRIENDFSSLRMRTGVLSSVMAEK